MKSILKDANTNAQMCFWATRYDCFADAEEFKLGVETIQRLLPFVEKDMPVDRQIASLFDSLLATRSNEHTGGRRKQL